MSYSGSDLSARDRLHHYIDEVVETWRMNGFHEYTKSYLDDGGFPKKPKPEVAGLNTTTAVSLLRKCAVEISIPYICICHTTKYAHHPGGWEETSVVKVPAQKRCVILHTWLCLSLSGKMSTEYKLQRQSADAFIKFLHDTQECRDLLKLDKN